MIDNPAYKGEWEHPLIDNPDFVDDKTVYSFEDFGAIGFDLWQVKAGTIFDNVLIADDDAALEAQNAAFKTRKEGEDKMKTEAEEAEKKQKEAEEAAKKAEEEAKKEGDEGEEVASHEEL